MYRPVKASANEAVYYNSRTPILFNIRTGEAFILRVTTEYMSGFVQRLLQYTNSYNHVIAYDFETSGVDPNTCEVIEYAFYDVNARIPIAQSLVKPRHPVCECVQQITGITN